jgi:thioredoxin-like negative regulator of GroEL
LNQTNLEELIDQLVRRHRAKAVESAFTLWSDDRYPAAAPTLADFLNWAPSNETQDDGEAEDIRETAEAAFAASSQGT